MDAESREFLESLLETPSPAGFEAAGQRVWTEYVESVADEVRTDAYGNAIAVHEGSGPTIAFAGHADEIGFMVREITDDGYLRLAPVGNSDPTVSMGQRVTIHAEEPVPGVIGQTAVHLRDERITEPAPIDEQFVDIGAADETAARESVSVGDPVTYRATTYDLAGTRFAARGLDDRVGTWVAAEGLRRAVERDVDARVVAVSTVQEELGKRGAEMVGTELDADAVIAADVTHATDSPDVPGGAQGPIALGDGPVIARGSANHPRVVESAREAAASAGIDNQLQATPSSTGTDADAFSLARGGTPSLNVGLPNRYMHTPVETIDTTDLDAAADLLAAVARHAPAFAPFAVDV